MKTAKDTKAPPARKAWLALLFVFCFARLPSTLAADHAVTPDYTPEQLKAAFLYQFALNTTWPKTAFANQNAPFVIGIYGKDPWGGGLGTNFVNRAIQGHKVAVTNCASVAEAEKCHLLFISAAEKKDLPKVLEGLKEASVLTVGETGEFTKLGGMIYLYVDNRLKYKVNEEAADRAKVRLGLNLVANAETPVRLKK